MELISTIAISRGTRDMLKELGHKGQTYDQLIQDLIKRKRIKKEPDSPDRRIETLQ
jgi:DNA-binding MarR family transcriptional regulator